MEGNFINKNLKPTLSTPTKAGKQVDTYFKKQMSPTGMSMKENHILNEKEESLKKKIFKLDKMETLVHTDEYLSKIFADFKQDADELYGYHWNETILNMIFNDYVLNSPKYLDKYKNTRAKEKTRRGEEGIAQLQNDIDKEKEVTSGAEERKQDLMKKGSKKETEDVDEGIMDTLLGRGVEVNLPVNQLSKNDTYFVDTAKNKLIAHVPYSAKPEEKQSIIQKNVGNSNIKQLSWYDALTKGVQGVPKEVGDGSADQMKGEFDKKYAKQGGVQAIPALTEDGEIGKEYKISDGSGLDSNKIVTIVDPKNVKTDGTGVPTNVSGAYKPIDWKKEVAIQYEDGSIGTMFKSRLTPVVSEDGSGSYSMGLDAQNGLGKDIADQTYQNETTTSASSGQYSGKAIWSKDGKPAANKPAWKGGQIVSESVINGDLDYFTDPKAFKQYILKNQIAELLTEEVSMDEASIKQDAEKYLIKAKEILDMNPESMNDKDFMDAYNLNDFRAKTGKAYPSEMQTNTVPTERVAETTDTEQYEDVVFMQGEEAEEPLQILNDQGEDAAMEFLKQWHDVGNHMGRNELPHGTSDQTYDKDGYHMAWNDRLGYIGLTYDTTHGMSEALEDENYKISMEKDLKYTGKNVSKNTSTGELENKDGLFKDKWNTNEETIVNEAISRAKKQLNEMYGDISESYVEYFKEMQGESPFIVGDRTYKYVWAKYPDGKIDIGVYDQAQDLVHDYSEFKQANGIDENNIHESMVDDQPDSMINPQGDSIAASMDSDELNKDGVPVAGASAPVEESFDDDGVTTTFNKQAELDANDFRANLKAKYGVDSIDQLSNMERAELIKSMNFGNQETENKPEMDFSKFGGSDDQKAEYHDRDEKRLSFLAQNADQVNSVDDFKKLAAGFKSTTGENMHHPMAILASIQALPQGSELRNKLTNIENVLKSNMKESVNEERKTPSILNVEKLGKENQNNFNKDSKNADALDKDKAYPYKESGIYKEKVWPDPSKFYIEQGTGNSQELAKKQTEEAKSMADIEKEALKRSNGTLNNIGDATADGKNIPKRNLTKEEGYALAMNRGDGMQDIVYDNKPSNKFEKRMEQDLGNDVYKSRQDKIEYKKDAPMYNKDTQPTENGDKKEQDNKFIKGYNSESITGKYKDEFNKFKLFEFELGEVEIVESVNEDAFKLSVDGMGNKFTHIGKEINENVGYEDASSKYDFYLIENKVYAVVKGTKTKVEEKTKNINESFNKMKHLMNYKPHTYVDAKKSVKF